MSQKTVSFRVLPTQMGHPLRKLGEMRSRGGVGVSPSPHERASNGILAGLIGALGRVALGRLAGKVDVFVIKANPKIRRRCSSALRRRCSAHLSRFSVHHSACAARGDGP